MQLPLWLSTGSSRKETSWKNVQMMWPELVEKMKTTVVTPETLKEYLAFPKSLQDERKDVGGFVGGTIAGGRRKKAAITNRSLLTLDIDFGTMDFWDDFTTFYEEAAFIYGTHKHSEKSPRFRLVMPLSREVLPDEYQALTRRLAGNLDIEIFDPTTFQPERLMFWPSTPKDQEYYCREQAGPWLDPDKVLAQYKDWRDQSQWPVSAKVEGIIQGNIAKQGDPLSKPGMIGVFCRTYTISEVIEKYLSDIYTPFGDSQDRYTFSGGSTAGGLVVYDDLFAYSHHATDPAGGKCSNAWDLVRHHKFESLDDNTSDRTSIGKLPSQAAMLQLVNGDRAVIRTLGTEKWNTAREMFGLDPVEGEGTDETEDGENPTTSPLHGDYIATTSPLHGNQQNGAGPGIEAELIDTEWMGLLKADKQGMYETSYANIALILDNDPHIRGRVRYNEMSSRTEISRRMPWDRRGLSYPRMWSDDDWGQLRKMMGSPPYELLRSPKLEDCMAAVRSGNCYHPVRDYLGALVWDGQDRLDDLLIDYLGAEDCEYTKQVTRKTLVAAVARIYQPGVKFDHVLTLVGKQRIGKSTLIARMGLEWFTDTFSFAMLHSGNKAFEQIRGRWVIEIGEMAGLRKAEVEAAKSFISSQQDIYRPAYGKEVMEQPRQSIFIGTTNKKDFLKKFGGGNGRFWPVDLLVQEPAWNIFKGLTKTVVDLLWAEAVERYKQGEPIHLSPEMEAQAFQIQGAHEEIDDMTGIIENFLETKLPVTWDEKTQLERVAFFQYRDEMSERGTVARDKVCAPEIWCECLKRFKGDMTTQNTKFIHDIMREMPGWIEPKNKMRFKEYGLLRGYAREGSAAAFVTTDKPVAALAATR